jgi:hypothetical protein
MMSFHMVTSGSLFARRFRRRHPDDLLRTFRRDEREDLVVELNGDVPRQHGDVLRLSGLIGCGDDKLTRQWLLTPFDPKLPVDVLLAERVVVAIDAPTTPGSM